MKDFKILAIYDNPKYADRYTVYFNQVESVKDGTKLYYCVGMSADAASVYQHSAGMLGRHNGKKIHLVDLPKPVLLAIISEYQPLYWEP
jgi:hypothetical protein